MLRRKVCQNAQKHVFPSFQFVIRVVKMSLLQQIHIKNGTYKCIFLKSFFNLTVLKLSLLYKIEINSWSQ